MSEAARETLKTSISNRPRYICLTLEAPEIIELKQAVLDRDVQGAVELFRRVIAPRVQTAAQRRGIALEEAKEDDGRLPG
jgi:hypothetical protein